MLSNILKRFRILPKSPFKSFSPVYTQTASPFQRLLIGRTFIRRRNACYYGLSFVALAAYCEIKAADNDANTTDDAINTVSVDKNLTPFPVQLGPPKYPLSTEYSLLGYGYRYVTFLSFKVYALGIYIANQDKHLIPEVLDSNFLSTTFIDLNREKSHNENVRDAMSDPVKSTILIGNLLDSGCRMLAKITPVRNTDFKHLKDGLVRTILNHPKAKNNQELLNSGLNELKLAFTEKGRVPKNDDLLLELQADGSLQLLHYNRQQDSVVTLGSVREPLVGKFLFSQYMSGSKPLSPTTQKSVAERIAAMV